MANAKLSSRLDARQNHLLNIVEDASSGEMDGAIDPDEWGIGEWKRDSNEIRYFSPHEEGHPLRYFGADKYMGEACPCQKGNEPACSFHYPNGHPSIAPQRKRPIVEPSQLQTKLDCAVCGGSVDFPCLKCIT
jgi:hypothetical protein